MCYEFDSEVVLANYFQKNKSKKECTFKDLNKLKSNLEKKIPGSYVDISKNSVLSALENHPKMFSFRSEKIYRNTNNSSKYYSSNYVNAVFNNRIEREIFIKFETVLSEYIKKYKTIY